MTILERIRLRLARFGVVLVVAAFPVAATPASAQARQAHAPTRDVGVSWQAVGISAFAVAAALPFDGRVRTWMQDPARQNSGALGGAADVLTPLGSVVPVATGAFLYGFARAFHHPTLADEVWHSGEAVAVASAFTQVLKTLTHRARPYVAPHDPGDFFRGPGLSLRGDHASFPSGHTTLAFAVAGAAAQELSIHDTPHAELIGVGLYGLAIGVGFFRIYDDRHWLSDVVAGAAIGTLVSRLVVRWEHRGAHGVEGDARASGTTRR